MYGYNRFCCSGRPITDIKVGYSKTTGRPYTFFMFAIPSYIKIKTGKEYAYLNKPIIIQCRAFGEEAIRLGKWISKGRFIILEGKLLFDEYAGKESGKYYFYVENHYNTPKIKANVNFKEESAKNNNVEEIEEDEIEDTDLLDNEHFDEKE